MRACSLVGCLFLTLSCGSGQREGRAGTTPRAGSAFAPVALRLTLAPGEVLVYRRTDAPEGVTEIHWIERRDDGGLVLGVDDPDARAAGRDLMPADLVLPLTEEPVGREVIRVSRPARAGGLQLLVDEEVQVVGAAAGMVRVRFRRRTSVVDAPTGAPARYLEQTGEATFEPTAGRYSRISFTETRADAFGGGSGATEWAYDPRLSREWTARRRSAAGAAVDLDAWEAEHDLTAEIAAIVDALADPAVPGPPPALAFQVHAHPGALWDAVLQRPEAGARFVQDPRVAADFMGGPPDEVFAVLRSRRSNAGFADALVARTADARLRPELRQLAASRGPDATEARLTLQALDLAARPTPEAWRPFGRFPARLQAIWARLSARGADPSPLVPAMLALASGTAVPAQVGAICLEVVRAAGLPEASDDRRVLRQWWSTEGEKPWAERLLAAARTVAADRRGAVLQALARTGDPAAREALVAALDEPGTRKGAALALATLRDGRAAPALVEALEDPGHAAEAFDALGALGQTTLGFDPTAAPDDPGRAAALARWQEWLRRRR